MQGSMGKIAQDLVGTEMLLDSKYMLLPQNEAELSAIKKQNEIVSTELAEERFQRAK